MDERQYCVYIMSNKSGALYIGIGVTNDIVRWVSEHQAGTGSGFTSKYKITQLVLVELTTSIEAAIAREKQIKGWTRAKKLALIAEQNPEMKDLSQDF